MTTDKEKSIRERAQYLSFMLQEAKYILCSEELTEKFESKLEEFMKDHRKIFYRGKNENH